MKKKEIPLVIPPPISNVTDWLIFGLDPSLSRTGYALMLVSKVIDHSMASWVTVGSIKPEKSNDPIWVRGKAMAKYLHDLLATVAINVGFERPGLIISMEYPTPMNDYLVALNRIIHLVFFEDDLWQRFASVRILTTNASTLRSLMTLTKKGAKNKVENITRAYDFIDRTQFPELDTDSCDAVLLSMMGRHVASIMLGQDKEVPDNFRNTLCNATQDVKGKGRNARVITKGLLHRPEYWYSYERRPYTLCIKDAACPKKILQRQQFDI